MKHADVEALITDVQYIRSTDNGVTFDRIVNLSNYSGWSINPQIAVSQKNNVYVVWTNNFQEKYGQVFFTSTDNGVTFDRIRNLGNNTGFNGFPQIAVSGNNVYVVWENTLVNNGTILLATSIDNGVTFDRIVNLSNYSGWSINPQIAVSQNNSVYIVWTNNATGNEEIVFKKATINNNCISLNVGNREKNLDDNMSIDVKSAKSINIAIVDATFTGTAYDKSLYMFYEIYKRVDKFSNITKYTDLLSSKLIQRQKILSEHEDIVNHLKWLTPKSTINVLRDEDVHNGSSVFTKEGTNIYDLIILGHQEYVTQQEYDNLKRFVANGGTLILLDGNVLYAEVKYDENTKMISLVKGHGFAYNGVTAWKSIEERWVNETSKWVGSNYLCCYNDEIIFRNDPFGITHNEEQYVTNPRAKILLDYNATENNPNPRKFVIATYELEYKKGKVITLGIWTDDTLFKNDRFLRFFDSLLFQYVLEH